MKNKNNALTMVEMLTVIAIMAILISLLIPAISMVRRTAKETQQKAQFAAIEMALMAFRGDSGDYPPSHGYDSGGTPPMYAYYSYCGAQTLAGALLGWDLLGFEPNSIWTGNGYTDGYTDITGTTSINLDNRKGPYLETSRANAFKLTDLFGSGNTGTLVNTFVICDSFGVKPVMIGGKAVKAGTPILYYKANTASKTIDPNYESVENRIYNAYDNQTLLALGKMTTATAHPLGKFVSSDCPVFYGDIRDHRITTLVRPYRPDSYILISAGLDGLYGTSDDITNFGQ